VANVTFSGTISAQAAVGETVTIIVTKPDGTKDTWTTPTNAVGAYSITETYTVAGSYSAVASVAADTEYAAATSPPVTFSITLTNRTVTINVTLS
jgi:hypothetical protein